MHAGWVIGAGVWLMTAPVPAAGKERVMVDDFTNRLAGETSPYLLQHAHNPVDWYPWGAAALARARQEHKPIFLSIGYSACHWCHVMERESFEDRATAELLNQHFVCIKVDREERPDLDELYMTSVQLMGGSGGWPLSVFLTPDLKPFYGGTYFPPADRFGLPGFRTVLLKVADLWEHRRAELLDNADAVAGELCAQAAAAGGGSGALDLALPARAARELSAAFDTRFGGFGGAPKFPPSAALGLLLRQHARTHQAGLLSEVTFTLDRMAAGGLHDQLGGGFHRYSVDAQWLVPHFEKMLNDNALLASAYLAAWQVTGQPRYRQVAMDTLDYVLRDMTAPDGGFYSAQDADSEGEEGRFYVWTRDEILEQLGAVEGGLFCRFYGVDAGDNFAGRSILHVPRAIEQAAQLEQLAAAGLERRLDGLRAKLLAVRARRAHPNRDEKVLTGWNALMISALVRAGRAFDEPRYSAAAGKAADFILTQLCADGRLLHAYCAGRLGQLAFLDDHALFINALLDLYETTGEPRRAAAADEFTKQMLALFRDEKAGGFYMASSAHTNLLARTKPAFDGQEPSGNAAAAQALWRLGRLFDKAEYLDEAGRTLKAFMPAMQQAPRGYLNLIGGLDEFVEPGPEIVIVGPAGAPETRALWRVVHQRYLPGSVLAGFDPAQPEAAAFAKKLPLLADRQVLDGRATAYVCRHYACQRPVHTPDELRKLLP